VQKSSRAFFRKPDTKSLAAVAGATLLVIVAIAMSIVVVGLRSDALDEARRNIANLAFVLGEQTARSAQSIDLALRDLQDTIRKTQADAGEAFRRAAISGPFQLELKEMAQRLNQADFIAILDAKGQLISASNGVTGLNLSTRDYFRYFASNSDAGVFISAPAENRVTGFETIYFARRFSSTAGEFLGIIVCGVPIRYFDEIYSAMDLPRNESFLLARRDGTVLVRHPDPIERAGVVMPATSPWYKIVSAGGGLYDSPGYFDETPRMVAVRPLTDFSLVVDCAVAEWDVLAAWRRQAFFIVAGFILIFAYAIFLLRLQYRQVMY